MCQDFALPTLKSQWVIEIRIKFFYFITLRELFTHATSYVVVYLIKAALLANGHKILVNEKLRIKRLKNLLQKSIREAESVMLV